MKEHPEILVVGAGPAGLAAAAAAAERGARVRVVDDNPFAGGQIWRNRGQPPHEAAGWFRRFQASGAEFRPCLRIVSAEPGQLVAESEGRRMPLPYGRLILATGARERWLPFPGWTLPGVIGAGGLQALAKGGWPVAGKRVIVAGAGPLLLASAVWLADRGADVRLVAEQASFARLAPFFARLARWPAKLRQALGLRFALGGVPYLTGCWVTEALGQDRLEAVRLENESGAHWTERCDYLAIGFGLVPNVELPALIGCEIRNGAVQVDRYQRTSLPDTWCAGEPAGIAGLDAALVQGRIAGLAAAGLPSEAALLFARRDRERAFGRALERAFTLREEIRGLSRPSTILCRCEDVPFERAASYGSWREAKLLTRCGMGPCQGRICGAAAEFLFGWEAGPPRPPVLPAPLEVLAETQG